MQPYIVGDTNQHIKDLIKGEEIQQVIDGDDSDMGEAEDDWFKLKYWFNLLTSEILSLQQASKITWKKIVIFYLVSLFSFFFDLLFNITT